MVRRVAKASPKAIAVDNCCHHCVDGAPIAISRVTKSILTRVTIGSTPNIVVAVVSRTGRKRCAPVRMIASRGDAAVLTMRSKVSIRTMLLLTTIPASAMTPIPLITMPKGCSIMSRPSMTPTVDIMTAERIRNAE